MNQVIGLSNSMMTFNCNTLSDNSAEFCLLNELFKGSVYFMPLVDLKYTMCMNKLMIMLL